MSEKNLRVFLVDATLKMRFAATAENPTAAKTVARGLARRLMASGVLGTVGWSFEIDRVDEAKVES